jgi:hypothetical protein
MSKVKCKVCANEVSGFCKVKKMRVKVNKPRTCEVYIYDETKLKAKEDIPIIKFGYKEQQEAKRRFKEEMKALKELAKQKPSQGTAKNLGLINSSQHNIITPGDPRFSMPQKDLKHPLTGDLSRFISTANKGE